MVTWQAERGERNPTQEVGIPFVSKYYNHFEDFMTTTKLTQEEGWCAGEVYDAITMHGWSDLMKARSTWLPRIGEDGWKRAFDSVTSLISEEGSKASELDALKEGWMPETDPDMGPPKATVQMLVEHMTENWPSEQKVA